MAKVYLTKSRPSDPYEQGFNDGCVDALTVKRFNKLTHKTMELTPQYSVPLKKASPDYVRGFKDGRDTILSLLSAPPSATNSDDDAE